ncbi:MAG: ion channel [Hormoscilla sp.]
MNRKTRQRQRRSVMKGMKSVQFVRLGLPHFHWGDLYHWLLSISWLKFLGLIGLFYLVTNILFALAYLAGGDGIANAEPGNFKDAFFFSIQTMATIGYGSMYPTTPYTHLLVTIEALFGLLGFANATGLMFARFSTPSARVLFSRVAVICPYNGVPTLMFRIANQRNNWILEAQLRVTMILPEEVTPEGHSLRRLCDLKLVRSETPILTISWMAMHEIDETSPLYGVTEENLTEWNPEIIAIMTGMDETVSQTIHARHLYEASDILWNVRFVDILYRGKDGDRHIDYNHFHDVTALANG